MPAGIVLDDNPVVREILTVALGARHEETSYPNFFACETTLDRRDALSKNISFATMLAL